MKTYTTTVEKPRLVIEHDDNMENPRQWSGSLGHFITCEKRRNSPDNDEALISLIQNLADESANTAEHIEKIKEELPSNGYGKVLAIYPVTRYEHGGVVYSLGTQKGFDYSSCGFYIVTDKTTKDWGKTKKSEYPKIIKGEIEAYNRWVNGESYMYMLYDKYGKIQDSCTGFDDIESMRERLPKEWAKEDLSAYVK